MSVLSNVAKEQIKNCIIGAADSFRYEGELPEFAIEIPTDRKHGDLAVNAAMVWARALHKSPRDIAAAIVGNAKTDNTYIEKMEIAGPGFINIFLSDRYFADVVSDVLEKGDNYGKSDYGKGKRILVEFVSANPTGPMHIGNARGGALGDCLAAVLEAAGYYVEREFYINDAGNQIEKFAQSLNCRYLQLYKEGIEIGEDMYQGADIIVHAENFAKEYGDKYVECDESERKEALVAFALPKNIQGLKDDLKKYRIEYNTWFTESSLHKSGAVTDIIEKLKQSGYTYEQDGALWFKATEFGCDKDFVLVRANSFPTYVVPDIAYHYNKLSVRNFDEAIDILGADHHGYVPRLRAALNAIGVDGNRCEAVLMQMVRLVRNGETIKASKRSGKAITLVTLLDEVPIDAARFFFNLREPNSHFDFDLDLAVEESNKNPVYYVQYAHARISSIMRNLKAEGITPRKLTDNELCLLKSPEERELIAHLCSLTDQTVLAAKTRNPTVLTKYVIDLATLFHKFYNACRVKGEDEPLMQARMALCTSVGIVIRNILTLMKIEAPERM